MHPSALQALADYAGSDLDHLQPILPETKLKGETSEAQAAEIAELKLRPFVQLFGESDASGLLYMPMSNTPLIGEITYGQFVLAHKNTGPAELQAETAALLTSRIKCAHIEDRKFTRLELLRLMRSIRHLKPMRSSISNLRWFSVIPNALWLICCGLWKS